MVNAFMMPDALKGQQWEIAKGHLRALVALQGSYSGAGEPYERFQNLKEYTEQFIKHVEDHGLWE